MQEEKIKKKTVKFHKATILCSKCKHSRENHTKQLGASIIGCTIGSLGNLCICKLHYEEVKNKRYYIDFNEDLIDAEQYHKTFNRDEE